MKKNNLHLALLMVALLILLSCGDNNPLAPEMRGENEVWIQNRKFVPQTLTVSKGRTVTWINKDNEVHTVDSGKPMNPTTEFNLTLDGGETGTHTFNRGGTFDYYCGIHGETGRIVVE